MGAVGPGSRGTGRTQEPAGTRNRPDPGAGPPRQATTSNSRFARKTGQNRHPTGPPISTFLTDRPKAGPPAPTGSCSRIHGGRRPPTRPPDPRKLDHRLHTRSTSCVPGGTCGRWGAGFPETRRRRPRK